MKSYKCSCCGAEILYNENQTIAKCLYCGNSIAIIHKEYSEMNIKKIVPFEVDSSEAISNFQEYNKRYHRFEAADEVVEAKKIYLPIRFCDFEFDYLFNYQYEVVTRDSDGHTHTSYYDTEELIDGYGDDEIIVGDGKISEVVNICNMREKSIDFDPAILKDVSIEYIEYKKEDNDKIIETLNNKVRLFSRNLFSNVTKVYSENYSLYNINIDQYTTLIPIYVIKTEKGLIFNFPGVRVQNVKEKNTLKIPKSNIIIVSIALLLLALTFGVPAIIVLLFEAIIPICIIYFIIKFVTNYNVSSIRKIDTMRYKRIKFSSQDKYLKF